MINIVEINGLKYEIWHNDNHVYVIQEFNNPDKSYPRITKDEIEKESYLVYKSRIWVQARGCNAVFEGITEEGKMRLNVRPSADVDILGAVQVDRGIYNVELPLDEVERVWEERMPYLDFKFPEVLPTVTELDVSDLKDTTKRFRG